MSSPETPFEKQARFAEALRRLKELDTKERCEENLIDFIEYAWPIVDPAQPFLRGYPLEAICDHLEAVTHGYIKRLLINVSPGSTKSTALYMWSAWEWGPRNMPWMRYVCASYSAHLSERDNLRCRHVVSNDRYRLLWGDRFDPDLSAKIKFSNDHTGWRLATSVGGVGIGERGDRFLIDDPNSIDAESEIVRKSTNLWFTEVVPDRLNNLKESAIVLIQQRLHEEDCTGTALSKNMEFVHLRIPLEYEPRPYVNAFIINEQGDRRIETFLDEDAAAIPEEQIFWEDWRKIPGENAWPERYPPEIVRALKRDKGPWGFAGQYQQRVVPRGGAIVGREAWQVWEQEKYPLFDYIVAGLDTAYTDEHITANDPSALTIWGLYHEPTPLQIDRHGRQVAVVEMAPKVMLLYAWARHLKFNELIENILDSCTRDRRNIGGPRFPIDRLLIEDTTVGKPTANELERIFGVTRPFGVDLIPVQNRSKVSRLWSIQHLFDQKMIYAPDRPWADDVINQMAVFPFGKHDDYVDSGTMVLKWLRDQNFLVTREEDEQELFARVEYKSKLKPLYPA